MGLLSGYGCIFTSVPSTAPEKRPGGLSRGALAEEGDRRDWGVRPGDQGCGARVGG